MNLIKQREISCLNFDKFKNQILKELDLQESNPDIDNFKEWFKQKINTEIPKYQFQDLEKEIYFKFEKLKKNEGT